MSTKVSVFCIWRDSENCAPTTLSKLSQLEALQDFEFSFFFYENDSKDATASIISDWMESRKGGFLSESLNAEKFDSVTNPERMKLLCDCRNKCKSLAGKNDSEYSLLIDGDIDFGTQNFLDQLKFLKDTENAAMVTPNVRQMIPDYTFGINLDSYYDVYAFRDRHGNKGMYFSDCPSYKRSDQLAWKMGLPIKCLSAFGGFAIIKSEIFNQVSWSADVNCDHVNMCFDISKMGDIYIMPRSVVYSDVDEGNINIDSCKNQATKQKEIYEKYF
jgi:hypothetical protein